MPGPNADLESEGLCPAAEAVVANKIAALNQEIDQRIAMRDRLAAALEEATIRTG